MKTGSSIKFAAVAAVVFPAALVAAFIWLATVAAIWTQLAQALHAGETRGLAVSLAGLAGGTALLAATAALWISFSLMLDWVSAGAPRWLPLRPHGAPKTRKKTALVLLAAAYPFALYAAGVLAESLGPPGGGEAAGLGYGVYLVMLGWLFGAVFAGAACIAILTDLPLRRKAEAGIPAPVIALFVVCLLAWIGVAVLAPKAAVGITEQLVACARHVGAAKVR